MLFAFMFPELAGHFNASLPVARALVERGHEVHYLCGESKRKEIERTGAVFHSDQEHKLELYEGRDASFGPMMLMSEFPELASDNPIMAVMKLNGALMTELQLPGELRWLRSVKPDVIFYNPELSSEAGIAASILGTPAVGLVTVAGPGGMEKFMIEMLAMGGLMPADVEESLKVFPPHVEAVARLNETYKLNIDVAPPVGLMRIENNRANVVTTIEELRDPLSERLAGLYEALGTTFSYVGPLLDERTLADPSNTPDVLSKVQEAKEAGRSIVLVSMGTMIPGDCWEKRYSAKDGKEGLSGLEMCRAVWKGTFDALGADDANQGPLLLVSLGPQKDALGDMAAPPNAITAPVLPQVDVLKIGVNVFLTHGGQNSFMEALSTGTPVVMCPYDTDQPVNAQKAVSLGVGLKVDRPDPVGEHIASTISQYSEAVCLALITVQRDNQFSAAACCLAEQMKKCRGVPRVVDTLLSSGSQERTTP